MKFLRVLLAALAFLPVAALATSPTDIVPRGSGLYDAVALLGQKHLLPADATDLLGVTSRLYTRQEFANFIRGVNADGLDARTLSALAFARTTLAPELGRQAGGGVGKATLGATGFLQPELLTGDGDAKIYGRGRILGTLGRDGAYTASVTNFYQQTRNHQSYATRGKGDNPDGLDGIDEAYASVMGHGGVRGTVGLIRQNWGSAYRGQLLVSDNGPAHLTAQLEAPFSLSKLGNFRFTQYESTYKSQGRTVYQGGRRLEHPIGDRVEVSLEEAYVGNDFSRPQVLLVPFYTFQIKTIPNAVEPQRFNYLVHAGLTVKPRGPGDTARLYGQLLIDDITAPGNASLGNGSNRREVRRKIGYLLGVTQAFPVTKTHVVLEFAHADRAIFANSRTSFGHRELAWFDNDLPLGAPVGTNSNELYLRVGQTLTPKLELSVEGYGRRRVADDFPSPEATSFDIGLAYRLNASSSVGLRYYDYKERAFSGTANAVDSALYGATSGDNLHRHIVGVSFLQAF